MIRAARRALLAQQLGRRAFDWLHGTAAGVFAVALAVGAGAGLGAVFFRALIGAEMPTSVAPDTDLEHALRQLIQQERSALPVLDANSHSVAGWLTHRDLLVAYNARLERSVARARSMGAPPRPATAVAMTSPPEPALPEFKDYRIVELELSGDTSPVGRRVADVSWPPRSLVVAVRRNGTVDVPTGETTLQRGDRLTLLVPSDAADGLAERLAGVPKDRHDTTKESTP